MICLSFHIVILFVYVRNVSSQEISCSWKFGDTIIVHTEELNYKWCKMWNGSENTLDCSQDTISEDVLKSRMAHVLKILKSFQQCREGYKTALEYALEQTFLFFEVDLELVRDLKNVDCDSSDETDQKTKEIIKNFILRLS